MNEMEIPEKISRLEGEAARIQQEMQMMQDNMQKIQEDHNRKMLRMAEIRGALRELGEIQLGLSDNKNIIKQ